MLAVATEGDMTFEFGLGGGIDFFGWWLHKAMFSGVNIMVCDVKKKGGGCDGKSEGKRERERCICEQ